MPFASGIRMGSSMPLLLHSFSVMMMELSDTTIQLSCYCIIICCFRILAQVGMQAKPRHKAAPFVMMNTYIWPYLPALSDANGQSVEGMPYWPVLFPVVHPFNCLIGGMHVPSSHAMMPVYSMSLLGARSALVQIWEHIHTDIQQ